MGFKLGAAVDTAGSCCDSFEDVGSAAPADATRPATAAVVVVGRHVLSSFSSKSSSTLSISTRSILRVAASPVNYDDDFLSLLSEALPSGDTHVYKTAGRKLLRFDSARR